MHTSVYRYKWYLVGISNHVVHRSSECCDTIDALGARFVTYEHADNWYHDLNLCIKEGSQFKDNISYPELLGCHLVIHVELYCTYDN